MESAQLELETFPRAHPSQPRPALWYTPRGDMPRSVIIKLLQRTRLKWWNAYQCLPPLLRLSLAEAGLFCKSSAVPGSANACTIAALAACCWSLYKEEAGALLVIPVKRLALEFGG